MNRLSFISLFRVSGRKTEQPLWRLAGTQFLVLLLLLIAWSASTALAHAVDGRGSKVGSTFSAESARISAEASVSAPLSGMNTDPSVLNNTLCALSNMGLQELREKLWDLREKKQTLQVQAKVQETRNKYFEHLGKIKADGCPEPKLKVKPRLMLGKAKLISRKSRSGKGKTLRFTVTAPKRATEYLTVSIVVPKEWKRFNFSKRLAGKGKARFRFKIPKTKKRIKVKIEFSEDKIYSKRTITRRLRF